MNRASLLVVVSLLLVNDLRAQAPLEVVRTFGDLANHPPLVLRDGAKIRVGVEARHVAERSAVLLYALLDKADSQPAFDHPLGPLEVEVTRAAPKGRDRPPRALGKFRYGGEPPFFFVTSVFVDEAGAYELVLRDPGNADNPIVARTTLEVAGREAHAWLMFTGQRLEADERADEDFSQHALALTPAFRAQPRFPGNQPIPTPRDEVNGIATKAPLPRSHWQADPRLTLTATPTSLELTSKIPLGFVEPRHLLARVWINQKPFVPPADVDGGFRAAAKQAAHREGKVRIALDFNPALFGAKKGDRIGIQLLYCPDGAMLAPRRGPFPDEQAKTTLEAAAAPRLPLATPKAEFVVP